VISTDPVVVTEVVFWHHDLASPFLIPLISYVTGVSVTGDVFGWLLDVVFVHSHSLSFLQEKMMSPAKIEAKPIIFFIERIL
jgi:hypothetical protein